jgi:hypothetical protein
MNSSWFITSLTSKTMNSTNLNGLRRATGIKRKSSSVSVNASQQQPWLSSPANHDPAVVLAYKTKGRRALLAAKADARRRSMKGIVITTVLVAAFIACGYTLHREQQLIELERSGHIYR